MNVSAVMQTKILQKKQTIKELGDNIKSMLSNEINETKTSNVDLDSEFNAICWIPPQDKKLKFECSTYYGNTVFMSFNKTIRNFINDHE